MYFRIFLLFFWVLLCNGVDQNAIDYISNNLDIQFKVVNNLNGNNENYNARITLMNKGTDDIVEGDWEIYFYSFYLIEPDNLPDPQGYVVAGFCFNHVNGILFKFQPVAGSFKGISSGSQHAIDLVIAFWSVSRTDVMPRWYVTAPERSPKTITSTKSVESDFVADFDSKNSYKRYAEDVYSPWTPQERYDRYNQYTVSAKPKEIIPTPVEQNITASKITVDSMWKMNCSVYQHECGLVKEYFQLQNRGTETSHLITFTQGEVTLAGAQALYMHESYELSVASERIVIKAPTSSGAFYAAQSLFALANKNEVGNTWSIPRADVKDAPRFQYRGMHLDVARNFIPKEEVTKLLNVMAMYKLNNFHFHLTDDEGWRIQISDYPELTTIGGKRAHDLTETKSLIPQLGSGPTNETRGSGFYTEEDYKEILKKAASLHIRVVPEIDLPGHAHAAVKANLAYYERLKRNGMSEEEAAKELISDRKDSSKYLSVQLFTDNAVNPCINGTYKFVRTVVKRLIEMHQGIQNLTLFHLGGDEVGKAWEESPECKKLFSQNQFPQKCEGKQDHAKVLQAHSDPDVTYFLPCAGEVNTNENLLLVQMLIKNFWNPCNPKSCINTNNSKTKISPCDRDCFQSAFSPVDLPLNPDLLEYFMATAIHGINKEKADLNIGVWEDGALDENVPYEKNKLTNNDVYAYAWQNIWEWNVSSRAYALANAGYKAVMSQATNLYFDHPYEPDPEERGLYWATRFTDTHKTFGFMPDNIYANADFRRDGNPITFDDVCPEEWCVKLTKPENIVGMQGQLFSETILSEENFYYMVFPRLLALAERAWHKANWEATKDNHTFDTKSRDHDWSHFAAALSSREFKRLNDLGIKYRIAPPGVSRNNKTATISCEFSGFPVQYKKEGQDWSETRCGETVDLQTEETVEFRSVSPFDKDHYSRSIFTDASAALRFQMTFTVFGNVVCFILMRACLI